MWLRCLLPLALLLQPASTPHEDFETWIDPDLRVEHFVVYTRHVETGRTPTIDVAGFVELRRRDTEAGPQLESDTRFLVGALQTSERRSVQRVLHVECPNGRGPRCVWREVGPGRGRSVEVEWSKDGNALEICEWSSGPKRKGTLVVSGGATMPLALIELLRSGSLTAGNVVVFDPLALTLEPLTIKTVWLDDSERMGDGEEALEAPGSFVRTVELARQDGSLAGRYRFRGRNLVAFQWQDGPTFARAVDEPVFESLLSQHTESFAKTAHSR